MHLIQAKRVKESKQTLMWAGARRFVPYNLPAVNLRKKSIQNYTDECIRLRAARNENPNPNLNPYPNSHDHCLLSKWKCRTCAHSHLCNSL